MNIFGIHNVTHRTIFCIQNCLSTIIGMYFKLNCHANQLPKRFYSQFIDQKNSTTSELTEKYAKLVWNLQSVYIIKIISNTYFSAEKSYSHVWNRMVVGNKRSWWSILLQSSNICEPHLILIGIHFRICMVIVNKVVDAKTLNSDQKFEFKLEQCWSCNCS